MVEDESHDNVDYTLRLKFEYLTKDVNTRLPTLAGIIGKLKEEVELNGSLGFIVINITTGEELESIIEWSEYEHFLREFSNILKGFKTVNLSEKDILFIKDVQSSEFTFAISSQDGEKEYMPVERLEDISSKLKDYIDKEIKRSSVVKIKPVDIEVGYSRLQFNPAMRTERQIYLATEKARQYSSPYYTKRTAEIRRGLTDIISKELIETYLQPIFDLKKGEILGYEALSRSTLENEFSSTEILFTWAERLRLDLHLDIICRKKAFERANAILKKGQLLFLNTIPRSIDNYEISLQNLTDYISKYKIDPSKVVLEITERTAIENLETFTKNLSHFKNAGLKIAIDDAGAGYASLNSIARLRPEYLKFDMALVRNIHQDPIKQELLIIILNLAEKIGAHVIAEGIETDKEFDTLIKFGVTHGQGFYLGEPVSCKILLNEE